jgi:hypothetical protein
MALWTLNPTIRLRGSTPIPQRLTGLSLCGLIIKTIHIYLNGAAGFQQRFFLPERPFFAIIFLDQMGYISYQIASACKI